MVRGQADAHASIRLLVSLIMILFIFTVYYLCILIIKYLTHKEMLWYLEGRSARTRLVGASIRLLLNIQCSKDRHLLSRVSIEGGGIANLSSGYLPQ